jgi:hypothetical protein
MIYQHSFIDSGGELFATLEAEINPRVWMLLETAVELEHTNPFRVVPVDSTEHLVALRDGAPPKGTHIIGAFIRIGSAVHIEDNKAMALYERAVS